MSKLIYHNVENRNSISPFDEELKRMVNGQIISIVSPYIGLVYLKDLITISKEWRLLTDFQEWILAHPSGSQRESILKFIVDNQEKVKHVKDIHAKVVITGKSAFLGSANLTESGVLKRTEMSIVLSEKEKIMELTNWFNKLWDVSTEFSESQLTTFLKENSKVDCNPLIQNLPLDITAKAFKKVNFFSIQNLAKTDEEYETDLKNAVEKQTDKHYLNRYFDLVQRLYIELNIKEDSLKMTMAANKDRTMPITIGQRYVTKPKNGSVGLLLPLDFGDVESDYPNSKFNGYFKTKKQEQAMWVYFEGEELFSDAYLYEEWKKAVKTELDRTNLSGFRRSHNPFYYKAVMNDKYRKALLKLK